jgi:adhesin transport system membrane fusion protein
MSNSLTDAIEALPARLEPSRAATILLWTITGFFAVLILWAALARVDEVAVAQGRIIPSRQLQIVSNLEGGVVKAIHVKTGQKVSAGQVLLELDKTLFDAEYGKTSGNYDALVASAARLQAQVAGTPLRFPDGLAARSPAVVATESAVHSAQMANLATETGAANARLDQARRALGEAEAQAAARVQEAALRARELAMVAPLVEKGIEPQIELIRAQSAAAQSRSASTGADLAVRRAAGAVAQAGSEARNVRDAFRAESVEQLTRVRTELAGQGETLPALADRVARTQLRAPIAGTVNRVLVTTIGGSVRPGEPLVEIVPAGDALVVEAQVRPADIAFVHIGQKAVVKLTAYDYSVYGSMNGVVERISPDASVNEKTGESFFTIRVATTGANGQNGGLLGLDGKPLPIGVGMVAEVDLLGQRRSVLSYLLTPVSKLRDNAFREK